MSTPMEVGFLKQKESKESLESNENYRMGIVKLLFIPTVSHPDIAGAVGILCRKMNSLTKEAWIALKIIAQYLKGTADLELVLPACEQSKLVGYMDANWAEDNDDRKSTSGNVFFYGGEANSWLGTPY
ncbi:uncharacterized protein LOC128322369 [Hemicordylus capensis]|uniref:uncharacterized protein LOC128322369 n=1 Tax=Hemicordylus capensis TaxID=884348 RepID=UPI002303AEC2|nr:uncharacterized protein LOC128322369 [Hemicordylus capensis]